MSDLTSLPPLLLPSPRQLTLTGGTTQPGEPQELGEQGVSLPGNDAYHLDISASGIRWGWRHANGRRHAEATLAQLRRQYPDALPCLVIEDAPVFAVRGVMLDVSRDRVPTMAHLLATVDLLASWKINHLQLYTEHTFAYAGHEEVWRDASPFTAVEMRSLDLHCRERGIALVANQNCFGHLLSWLRRSKYAPLGEIGPDGTWDFNGLATRKGGFSLCPSDPRSLALVQDLLGQLLPNFSTPLVNIGCDETFDLGQGRSRYEVSRRGRAAVYLEFVRKICAAAKKLGKRPMFWADIALEHPEALDELPEELIGLAWGYEADAPFARWCDQLRAAGREVWVCPGTSCWRSITGRTRERQANQLAAARDGAAHGATGYLVTAWGDLGHRQQWPITLHALAEGAHRAWSGAATYDSRASSLHAFGDDSGTVARWLDAFGDVDAPLRAHAGKPDAEGLPQPLRNASALFNDQQKGWGDPGAGTPEEWSQLLQRLTLCCEAFTAIEGRERIDPLLRRELRVAAQEALLTCRRAVHRRGAAPLTGQERTDHRDLWLLQLTLHRETWLARSRPGGLDSSARAYELLAEEQERG